MKQYPKQSYIFGGGIYGNSGSVPGMQNQAISIKADAKMTFQELTDWYLKLEKVKALASYDTIRIPLAKFNKVYGSTIKTVKNVLKI